MPVNLSAGYHNAVYCALNMDDQLLKTSVNSVIKKFKTYFSVHVTSRLAEFWGTLYFVIFLSSCRQRLSHSLKSGFVHVLLPAH